MKSTKVTITGLTPLIMHNGALADPLNPATQALAKATSKRKKTLDDHEVVARCEFMGSLYLDESGHPCLPGEVLEAALTEGAKRFKLGKVAKGGLIVAENAKLVYDGPKTADGLWANNGFRKRAGVRIGTSRVIRTRPMFSKWSCTFNILWDPTLIKDADQVIEIAEAAGMSGIGDWRPKFGRFSVVA